MAGHVAYYGSSSGQGNPGVYTDSVVVVGSSTDICEFTQGTYYFADHSLEARISLTEPGRDLSVNIAGKGWEQTCWTNRKFKE